LTVALTAEEARLRALDASHGLRSEEAASLREIAALRESREARAASRASQQEALKLMQATMAA
jgi:hypothetical protein